MNVHRSGYKCARCGREIAARTITRGGASVVRPYPHLTDPYCRWSARAERCDGHLHAALKAKATGGAA